VITHRSLRPALRAFAGITTITVALALPMLAAPAFADRPAGWDQAPHVSAIKYLLVLLIIPGGIALLISLLVMLPSLVRGDSYHPGETWAGGDEWFGGPSKGVEAARSGQPTDEAAGERGGAGADF
jgi:hypothetical protein